MRLPVPGGRLTISIAINVSITIGDTLNFSIATLRPASVSNIADTF